MDKLKSRKLILTIVGIAIVAIATFFEIEIPAETLEGLLGLVAAYVVGQGVVDAAAAISAGKHLGEAAKEIADASKEVAEVAG